MPSYFRCLLTSGLPVNFRLDTNLIYSLRVTRPPILLGPFATLASETLAQHS